MELHVEKNMTRLPDEVETTLQFIVDQPADVGAIKALGDETNAIYTKAGGRG